MKEDEAQALAYFCPTCGAEVGQPCFNPRNPRKAVKPHWIRVDNLRRHGERKSE